MLVDAREIENGAALEADVCVVGAGAAGISLARALARAGRDVVVLESGGLEPEPEAKELLVAENAGDPYFPLEENRDRALGGTTSLWAGWCRPLDPIDFERREWVPGSGWPFGREELDPWYERAHEVLELGPYEYRTEWWTAQLGRPPLPLDETLAATEIFQLSPPVRFGSAFRDELEADGRIRIVLHATALELVSDREARAVQAVQAGSLDGRRFRVEPALCVLAAGGVECARLLLLSRGARPRGLANEHDLVGRFFMEHLHFPAGVIELPSRQPRRRFELYVWRPGKRAVGRLFAAERARRREGLLNASVHIEPLRRSRVARALKLSPDALWLHLTLEQVPDPQSRIVLGESLDGFGLPRARVVWRTGEAERTTFLRTRELVAEAFAKAGFGTLKVEPGESGETWPPPPLQGLRGHHMGTTRMSDDPREGVVDRDCRVHGLENLFVASSSVFPTSGAGTPTITIVALALRLADHLARLPARRGGRAAS